MAWCGTIPQIQEVRFSHKGNNEDVKETQEENCFQKLNEIYSEQKPLAQQGAFQYNGSIRR